MDTKRFVLELTDEEIKEKETFLKLIESMKQFIQSYFSLKPDIEEFVESGMKLEAGNPFRGILSALGQLLLAFKELIQAGFLLVSKIDEMEYKHRQGGSSVLR